MTTSAEPHRCGLTPWQIAELNKPLDKDLDLATEPDGTQRLRIADVRRLLVEIFGHVGYGVEPLASRCIKSEQDPRQQNRTNVIYESQVRLHIRCLLGHPLTSFGGIGIFEGYARDLQRGKIEDVVQVHHNVAAAAQSAAIQRAALFLGNRFGASLHADDPYAPFAVHDPDLALSGADRPLHIPAQATASAEAHAEPDDHAEQEGEQNERTDEHHHQPDQDPETVGS